MNDLVGLLRAALGDEEAGSFQLMGEDLQLISGPRLCEAAAAWQAEFEARVPRKLRARFEHEQNAWATEAHGWLRRFNANMHRRLRGYYELGRRCQFDYPWPVVAILGVIQVQSGIAKARAYGIVGRAARRLGGRSLEKLADASEDILRRTNRGIFADSVPTILYALRCIELRAQGEGDFAELLLDGPLPPLFDDSSRQVCRGIYQNSAIEDDLERFTAMAALTWRHFGREQEIFTHHILAGSTGRPSKSGVVSGRFTQVKELLAPRVVKSRHGRRIEYRRFVMPRPFDLRDHEARVTGLGAAFVGSVVSDLDDYRVAVAYVRDRFERPGEEAHLSYR